MPALLIIVFLLYLIFDSPGTGFGDVIFIALLYLLWSGMKS